MSEICKCGHGKDKHKNYGWLSLACFVKNSIEKEYCKCDKFEPKGEDSVSKEWCEHMDGVDRLIFHYKAVTAFSEITIHDFCPICGTPRPKPETLEDALRRGVMECAKIGPQKEADEVVGIGVNGLVKHLASIAHEFYKEKR